jgi:hypothetical protein
MIRSIIGVSKLIRNVKATHNERLKGGFKKGVL